MDAQIWHWHCKDASLRVGKPIAALAYGRDGGPHSRDTDVSLRAADDEGEVFDMLLQKRRNEQAAFRLMRKLLKNIGIHPKSIVTDGLRFYGAATHDLNLSERHLRRHLT